MGRKRKYRFALLSFVAGGFPVLKQTPLNATHRAAGARMVDFGGWDMPVNYGSQIDEHHAVRRDAGMFDVSHMRAVDLEGSRRARLPAPGARQQCRQVEGSRQGALFVPAGARWRRARRPDRVFPARGFLPHRRQRGDRGQGHRVVPPADRGTRAAPQADAARRPRDDRRAGTQRARQGVAGAAGKRSAQRGVETVRGRAGDHARRRTLHRTHRVHRRGRLRGHGAGRARRRDCGARWPPPASSHAAWARATRCGSRPG